MHRRKFLQGTGLILSLPMFESLAFKANAAKANSSPKRLVCVGNHLGYWPGGFFPSEAGKDYKTSQTLKLIDAHRDDFTVFSNLDHQMGGGHSAVHTMFSGVKKEESSGFADKNITIDQMAAEHAGSSARFSSINAGLEDGTNMCWTRAGVCIPPVSNPARLFEALFVQSDAKAIEQQASRLKHRASVLDALLESANSLESDLNVADKNKLDQYLTSIRDVEQRLQMSQEWLHRPKPNSPIDPVTDEVRMHIEEIPLFYDLLTLALQTDSTRVATFEIPMKFRTTELEVGSYHGLSHHGKEEGRLNQLQVVEAYLMKQFGHLLTRLKEAQVLDSTAVLLAGGMGNASSHSNRDLPIILAGGGFNHQGHVICPAEDHKRIPLSNLWLSTLQWFGVKTNRFGKSTGTFSPMDLG